MVNLFEGDSVRIGPITVIPTILKRFDVEPETLLSEAGLPLELFDDPDNLISFTARSRLIELCREKTGCDHIGLLIGKQVDLPLFGLIGYLALNSPNVETALRNLVRYFHLHSQGSMLTYEVKSDFVFFGYNIYQSGAEAIAQIEDAAVAIIFNALSFLCGLEWRPTEICFAHRVPHNLGPYRDFFRTPLRFNAEYSGVFFESAYLSIPVETADSRLFDILRKQVEQLEVRFSGDFPAQVKRMIITALPLGPVSADQIATLFTLHARTLNRRLGKYGTCFRDLVGEARYELAQQLLKSTDTGINEISEILGYADAGAFTKAFKRWSQTTPTEWRSNQQ